MALSACSVLVDCSGREMSKHGTVAFPVASYSDDLLKQSVPWHWHEEWELVIITEGIALAAIDSERFILQKGEGLFINTEVLHGLWSGDKSTCKYHSLVFHPRLVGGSIDSVIWQNYVQPLLENHNLKYLILREDIGWHEKILDKIKQAWKSCVEEKSGYELTIRDALSHVVFLLSEHEKSFVSKPSVRSVRDGNRMKLMLKFIHQHFGEEINVEEISISADISKSECLRCFHHTIGTTPIQYLIHYRIERAADLLEKTNEKIVDIGVQCGFQDMSYFSRTFRNAKGCTPKEWRIMKRSNLL